MSLEQKIEMAISCFDIISQKLDKISEDIRNIEDKFQKRKLNWNFSYGIFLRGYEDHKLVWERLSAEDKTWRLILETPHRRGPFIECPKELRWALRNELENFLDSMCKNLNDLNKKEFS